MVADAQTFIGGSHSDLAKRPPMRPRLMSPPGSAGAELPASCAMGSCATEGGEAGSEAVGEVTGDRELPAGALDDVLTCCPPRAPPPPPELDGPPSVCATVARQMNHESANQLAMLLGG